MKSIVVHVSTIDIHGVLAYRVNELSARCGSWDVSAYATSCTSEAVQAALGKEIATRIRLRYLACNSGINSYY